MDVWHNQHRPHCQVTRERELLLKDLIEATCAMPDWDQSEVEVLLGAVREYDNGGDQESENCTCDTIPTTHNLVGYDKPMFGGN